VVEADRGGRGEDVLVDPDEQPVLDQGGDRASRQIDVAEPGQDRLDPQFGRPFGEHQPQDDRLRLALPIDVVDDPQPDRPPLALFRLRDAVAKLYRVYVMSLYEHMFECAIASGGKPPLACV
jgi:hypothetical protein